MKSVYEEVCQLDPTSPSGLRVSYKSESLLARKDTTGYKHVSQAWYVLLPDSFSRKHKLNRNQPIDTIIMAIQHGDNTIKNKRIIHLDGNKLNNEIANLKLV